MSGRNLKLVAPVTEDASLTAPSAAEFTRHCIESLTRESIRRRRYLRAELLAEETRLTYLRGRLAKDRGVKFIRVESLEQEFGV